MEKRVSNCRQLLSCLSKKGVVFMVYHVQAATHFVAAHAPLDNTWVCHGKATKEKLLEEVP